MPSFFSPFDTYRFSPFDRERSPKHAGQEAEKQWGEGQGGPGSPTLSQPGTGMGRLLAASGTPPDTFPV